MQPSIAQQSIAHVFPADFHLRWLIMLRMNYSAAGAPHIVSYFAFALLTPAGTSITAAIRARASLGHLKTSQFKATLLWIITRLLFLSSRSRLSRFSMPWILTFVSVMYLLRHACAAKPTKTKSFGFPPSASFNSLFSNQWYNTQDRDKCKDCSYT